MIGNYRTDRLAWVLPSNVINVNPDPVNVANVVNMTSESTVLSGVPTTLVSYTVPAGNTFLIKRIKCTGHIESELDLFVDAAKRGYGWTSAAQPNFMADYDDTPVVATSGQVVTLVTTQYETASYLIRAQLEGELI